MAEWIKMSSLRRLLNGQMKKCRFYADSRMAKWKNCQFYVDSRMAKWKNVDFTLTLKWPKEKLLFYVDSQMAL
jgi:hypothetical protein